MQEFKTVTVRKMFDEVNKLMPEIGRIIGTSGIGYHNPVQFLIYNENDPDELQLRDELKNVIGSFERIYQTMKYMSSEVSGEYTVERSEDGKYRYNNHILTKGFPIEFYYENAGVWIRSTIEEINGYYSITDYPFVKLEGLRVRERTVKYKSDKKITTQEVIDNE